ncbi:hypothetical protein GOB92_27950 [Sinorhizobium meliloti]|nr:hypothetical protein [Sinorhizobium meliloti]
MINFTPEISDADKAKLSAIAEFEGTNFSTLVSLSGLSKTDDFIGADLSNVDFSNSDLRGFNFTDADLSGCYGVSFQIDETTNLTGANVSSSIFALEKEKREFFSMHKDHLALFTRLQKEYWTTGALWVGENLRRTSKNFEASAKIAKYLYAGVKDETYKNQILYGIRSTFRTEEEYKEFLLNQLIDPQITQRSLRGVIDILGKRFASDPVINRILLLHLGHENKDIRKLCIPPVMTRRFFSQNREAIFTRIKNESDPFLRMTYTQHFVANAGPRAAQLLFNEDKKAYHDYAVPIDDRLFFGFVRGAVRAQKIARKAARIQKGMNVSMGTDVRYDEVVEAMDFFESELRRFRDMGLPLKLAYSVDGFKRQLRAVREDIIEVE